MKYTIVYHKANLNNDCPDGICAVWIAATALGRENCELIGVLHQNDNEVIEVPFDPRGKNIIMLDFSYPARIMQHIAGLAESFVCLDHHEPRQKDIGSINRFSDRVLGIYSPNEVDCGATLTWKHFYGERQQPWFLTAVFAKDTGAFGYYDQECPILEAVATQMSALRTGKQGADAFEVFDQLLDANIYEVADAGRELLKERDEATKVELTTVPVQMTNVKEVLKKGDTDIVVNHKVPLFQIQNPFLDKHYSYVGAKLAQQWKQSFVVIQTTTEPDVYHLRSHSSSPYHLGEIAKSNGGGGHKNAAGFKINTNPN